MTTNYTYTTAGSNHSQLSSMDVNTAVNTFGAQILLDNGLIEPLEEVSLTPTETPLMPKSTKVKETYKQRQVRELKYAEELPNLFRPETVSQPAIAKLKEALDKECTYKTVEALMLANKPLYYAIARGWNKILKDNGKPEEYPIQSRLSENGKPSNTIINIIKNMHTPIQSEYNDLMV